MKKTILKLMVLVVLLATSLQGCFGKFALTRKLYTMNSQVENKYLRSGLTWVLLIVPVYHVVGLVDFVVINTIEFWSGRLTGIKLRIRHGLDTVRAKQWLKILQSVMSMASLFRCVNWGLYRKLWLCPENRYFAVNMK